MTVDDYNENKDYPIYMKTTGESKSGEPKVVNLGTGIDYILCNDREVVKLDCTLTIK